MTESNESSRELSSKPGALNDPLHGVKLEQMLVRMVERYGWKTMADEIPIRCFQIDPSIKSSLTFLRKTPWARKKFEDWYAYTARRFNFSNNNHYNPEGYREHEKA
jgi:uncharacterized protein (DUF2132 family)